MKEYKVMLKSIRTGEWTRPASIFSSGIFKDKSKAIACAKRFLQEDQAHELQHYCDYKIMAREVTPWEDT